METATEIKAAIGQMCLTHAKGTVQELGLTDAETTALLDILDSGNMRVSAKKSIRRSTRLPIRGMATVNSDSGIFRARLLDLSLRGARFICLAAWEAGDSVRVDMPTTAGSVEQQATVVRCSRVDGSVHEVAVEFDGVF